MRLFGDAAIDLMRGHAVGTNDMAVELELLLQAGNPDFKELIKVRRDDAQEAKTFKQRYAAVGGLRQDAPVEGEQGEFAVEEMFGGKSTSCGHIRFREWQLVDYVSVCLRVHDGDQTIAWG